MQKGEEVRIGNRGKVRGPRFRNSCLFLRCFDLVLSRENSEESSHDIGVGTRQK